MKLKMLKMLSTLMLVFSPCISQHYQVLETYNMEYEQSCISPLLDVLRSLNEERVTEHLRKIKARIAREEYDPACDNVEVVSVMYEACTLFFVMFLHVYLFCNIINIMLVASDGLKMDNK